MTPWLLPVLAAAALQGNLHAATIRGITVEHLSGKPLAQTLVTVHPLGGNARQASVRSNVNGSFELTLPSGTYLLTASRRGFALLQYGQKRWNAAGLPLAVEEGEPTIVSLRLQRFGAIVGTVSDENDVGLPNHDILAYRNTRPPQLVGRSRTDERGAYRIGGLEPGSYLVRTAAKQEDDESYLPTFSRETSRIDEAQPVDVALDRESEAVNARPFPGRLVTVRGRVYTDPKMPATVALVTDMGIETTHTSLAGDFLFKPVAPGLCELYAQAAADPRTGGVQAGYTTLRLDRDVYDAGLPLGAPAELTFFFEDTEGKPLDPSPFQVLLRGKNLSGAFNPELLSLDHGRGRLFPGRWDLSLVPAASFYVAGFSVDGRAADEERAAGWHEVAVSPGPMAVKFIISTKPGAVHGTVTSSNKTPIAAAPVYLEPYHAGRRQRLGELLVTRTDAEGRYRFQGLAPGAYRIVSTYEYQSPDRAAMDALQPLLIDTREDQDLEHDLELQVIR